MRDVRLRPRAVEHLKTAYQSYRDRADREVAERFLSQAEAAMGKLREFAHAYQPIATTSDGRPIRRMPFESFPYMHVYVIDAEDRVQILGCLHVRRARIWRALE